MSKDERAEEFCRLLDIMKRLRNECPWDREQNNESLRKLTIEETFELADAIVENNSSDIRKELGDLLLHIVFYSLIGEEKGEFDIGDVMKGINEKLIYRHPHVFGTTEVNGSDEVVRNWEKLKMDETTDYKPVLSGVPKALPAMVKATRIQEKVRGVGFDWEKREQVWEKVHEELEELKSEIGSGNRERIENEFGDLFFSLINAARLYNIDPDTSLERTNRKFIKRFRYLEEATLKKGVSLHDMSLNEMNAIWEKAKSEEKKI